MPELSDLLRHSFHWRSDPPVWPAERVEYADDSAWLRSPQILAGLGPALSGLHDAHPSVVVGTESRGMVLAALVASHLGVGMAEVRKAPGRASDDDEWHTRATGPDYRGKSLTMSVRSSQLHPGDRVLFVDDWVDTGTQMRACHELAVDARAAWIGAAVIVDALEDSRLRRTFGVRSLLRGRDL